MDSSAIVKRYVVEIGSSWVQGITNPATANPIFIAQITGVEVVSALVRRSPAPVAHLLARALADFRWDYFNQYQLVSIDEPIVARAMTLAELHRLRGYDAVQLAAALELVATPVASLPGGLVFISADTRLLAAATPEGLAVDNPNLHP